MNYTSLQDFKARAPHTLDKGPVCIILCEDNEEIASTLAHQKSLGFPHIVLVMPKGVEAPKILPEGCHTLLIGPRKADFTTSTINALIESVPPGTWVSYLYNAEYLFFPFCGTRVISEAIGFCTEERRNAMLTFVIDLYAADLETAPNGIDRKTAYLDTDGYYALARRRDDHLMHRQLNFYGGLRWRFQEHVAEDRRRIDRVGLFKTSPGLIFRDDHTLSDEELNTFEGPWHHCLTGAVCSFKAAKALKSNPGSRRQIETFLWCNSEQFDWSDQQLMDLGFMEPGQWF